tara:strand:+ start:1731 stop:2492 length:762 start_codon:yes stop_codon:yes gene_type:complete
VSNLRNYFAQAQDDANDNFFNYDGDDDFDFVEDEMDEFDSFDGDDDDAFDMATGGGGNAAPTSQPYIVVIRNTSAAVAHPVTILGSYNTLGQTAPSYQNAASISITMGISGISYQEFLYQSMNKPFVVGLTYYQSSTVNQVLETLTLIQKDVNGNESQKTLVPTIDPYQQQSTIIAIKFSYKIDGFTSVVMSSLLGGATAKLYFYPAETSSIARTLTGRRAVSGYGNPNIVKSDKISLSASATRALGGGRRRR